MPAARHRHTVCLKSTSPSLRDTPTPRRHTVEVVGDAIACKHCHHDNQRNFDHGFHCSSLWSSIAAASRAGFVSLRSQRGNCRSGRSAYCTPRSRSVMMVVRSPPLGARSTRQESVPLSGGARAMSCRARPTHSRPERDTVMMPNARDSRRPQPSVRFSRPIVPFEAFSGDHSSFHARLTELEQMTTDIRERIAHVEAGFHHLAASPTAARHRCQVGRARVVTRVTAAERRPLLSTPVL